MMNTKENILQAALHLFAKDGYEAVSMSTIAGELSMTKAALYKHYKNKRDIFNSIVERMYEIDGARADMYQVPKDSYQGNESTYQQVSTAHFKEFVIEQLTFWTEDDFASNFRKMLVLEQYRDEEMAELYKNCIVVGPLQYTKDIFSVMIQEKVLIEREPEKLAMEFYAPLYLLIALYDSGYDKEQLSEQLRNHIEHFFSQYRRNERQ